MTGRDDSRAGDYRPMAPPTTTAVMAPPGGAPDRAAVPDTGAVLEARVFTGPDFGSALASAWDDLFNRVPGASYSLSRPWQESFVAAGRCGDGAIAVTAWNGERLAALLVLSIRRRAGLRFAEPVGTEYPGYLGVLAEPNCDAGAGLIVATCMQERIFDVLCLHDVASDDAATQQLVAALTRTGLHVWRIHRTVCWRIRLGCTFEEYLRREKSTKSRKTLQREAKRLHGKHTVALQRLKGRDVTGDIIRRMADVQRRSWMLRRVDTLLDHSPHACLVSALALATDLRVWILNVDGRHAAFLLGVVTHRRLYLLWTAFDFHFRELSVGKHLIGRVIEDACAAGLECCDFGHGDADYKRFWATERHDVERVFVGRGIRGRVAAASIAMAWRAVRNQRLRRFLKAARRRLRSSGGADAAREAVPPDYSPTS